MDRVSKRVWVTYMEMLSPPEQTSPVPEQVSLSREIMDPASYMALYQHVGEPLGWDTRYRLSAGELALILSSPHSANYVLRDMSQPIGFSEFERLPAGDVEIKHFGLIPSHYGKGLGLPLLLNSLAGEWDAHPKRIWLHTDECDHPAAVGTYQKAGFVIFDRRLEDSGPL